MFYVIERNKIIKKNRARSTNDRKQAKLAPPVNSIHRFGGNGTPIYLPPWMSEYMNLTFVVPTIAFLVIIVGLLVICIALTKRRTDLRNGPKDVYCRLLCIPTYTHTKFN